MPVLHPQSNAKYLCYAYAFILLANLFYNSGRQFADWIENRIKSYQLIKDVDYITISRKYEIDGFAESKDILDYILTLDCAKQLAMVERTDIGALVRRYFIVIEKAFKNRINWNTNHKNTLINCKGH